MCSVRRKSAGLREMRGLTPAVILMVTLACARVNTPQDPWCPGALTLIDPDARLALAARLEAAPWPEQPAARASAVVLLTNWIRWRGIRAPLPFFQRLAGELDASERRKLEFLALSTYPGPRPYPPLEDPTAAWLLKDLARIDRNDAAGRLELVRRMLELVRRLGPFGDPRYIVRSTMAELLADLPPGDEATELSAQLILPGGSGNLRARAMLSLGVAGFSDPRLLPALINGLHSVVDHVNLAPFAQAALTGANGSARVLLSRAIAEALESRTGSDATKALGDPAGMPPDVLAAMDDWERSSAAQQDPTLMPRTLARVLVALGDEEIVRRLLVTRYHLAGRSLDFVPDETFLLVREILLTGIPPSRSMPAEEAAGIVAGPELAARAVAVSRVVRTCHPDLVGALQGMRHTAAVRLTTLDWIAQVRDAALKAALAKPELAAELTREWNSQDTEEGQWRKTAHLWMPLVQVPGEGKTACDETDSFLGMSPDEWLRVRIEQTLWICSAGDGPAHSDPAQTPAPMQAELEVAWSAEREKARADRAAACGSSRRELLDDWGRHTLAGCPDFECLWSRFVRDASKWPEAAVEKTMLLLASRLDGTAAQMLPKQLSDVPRELAVPLLEWFEPRLAHGIRVELRDSLREEKCLQDPACLPILLHAVALANRREIRSENIQRQ